MSIINFENFENKYLQFRNILILYSRMEVICLKTLGERIRNARKAKNLTQKQLAELIGAKHNSISDWENNKNKPDADTLELLMGALDIDANTLLGWNNHDQIKADAEELANEILSNKKVKEILPLLINLNDDDINLVKNFIQRLVK